MSEEKILGIIIAGLLFVYGIFRAFVDFKSLRDSAKSDITDNERHITDN